MGWIALYKDGTELREETHGRPVQDGEEGKLLVIAQEDFGHKVAVDLVSGVIMIDYDQLSYYEGRAEVSNPKFIFWICDDTNIVGDLAHYDFELVDMRDENGRRVLIDGKYAKVRNDILTPLTWRPIWFSRYTDGNPTKIVGAQTTTPVEFGAKNIKKMVNLYSDGRVGIY